MQTAYYSVPKVGIEPTPPPLQGSAYSPGQLLGLEWYSHGDLNPDLQRERLATCRLVYGSFLEPGIPVLYFRCSNGVAIGAPDLTLLYLLQDPIPTAAVSDHHGYGSILLSSDVIKLKSRDSVLVTVDAGLSI